MSWIDEIIGNQLANIFRLYLIRNNIIHYQFVKMGSTPSAHTQQKPIVQFPQEPLKALEELKPDPVLKQLISNLPTEHLTLKPSQSVNLQKIKNDTKVKKVRDIRSLQSLKDIKLNNNENEPYMAQITTDQIEDISVAKKAPKENKQLNPLAKKKLASDRVLISHQSKTQSVVSMIPLNYVEARADLQSRTKRYRVSKML